MSYKNTEIILTICFSRNKTGKWKTQDTNEQVGLFLLQVKKMKKLQSSFYKGETDLITFFLITKIMYAHYKKNIKKVQNSPVTNLL